jgi:hypothetical protein
MDRHRYFRILVYLVAFVMLAATASAADRFTDNGDGTITDNELGLMWGQADNNGDIDWHQAEKWVLFTFPLSIAKQYDNWRMPTMTELQSLVDTRKGEGGYETDCGQRVKLIAPIQLSCGWVWTSEIDESAPTARVFNFNNVYHYKVRKAHLRGYRALAVRNIE